MVASKIAWLPFHQQTHKCQHSSVPLFMLLAIYKYKHLLIIPPKGYFKRSAYF